MLNQYARQSQFTAFDFGFTAESVKADHPRKVVVGSSNGMIFLVNYDTRVLESVFKVHDSAICSLTIRAGFCVTGSLDQYIRVWPLDFSEFYLEAKHDGAVISLDVSFDGLKVSVGTSNGYLGVLDLANQNCTTIIRAHFGEIHALAEDSESHTLVSLGKDNSIRIWNTDTLQQNYEFTYTPQDECTVIDMLDADHFVGGFNSGAIRVFEIDSVSVVEELNYLNNRIETVVASKDSRFYIAGDEKAVYSVVDISKGYELVRYLYGDTSTGLGTKVCAAISSDSRRLALIGKNSNSIDLYNTETFDKVSIFSLAHNYAHSVRFNDFDANELIVLTCSGSVKIYNISKPDVVKVKNEIPASHGLYTSSIVCLGSGVYATAGEDACVKFWATQAQSSFLRLLHVSKGHLNGIFDMAVDSKQNRLFTTGGSEGIFVWDICEALQYANSAGRDRDKDLLGLHDSCYDSADDFDWERKGKEEFMVDRELYEKARKYLEYKPVNLLISSEAVFDKEKGTEQAETMYKPTEAINQRLPADSQDKNYQKPVTGNETEDIEGGQKLGDKLNERPSEREFIEYIIEPAKDRVHKPKAPEYIDYFKLKNDLSFNSYANEDDKKPELAFNKLNDQGDLLLKQINAINSNSSNSFIWHKQRNQIIYAAENKVIIEELEDTRTQKIIHMSEMISCITIAYKKNLLAVGTSTQDSNGYTPIYFIDLETFEMRNHHVHKRGVQKVVISPNEEYVMSIGGYKDRALSIYKLKELSKVHSAILPDAINDCTMAYNSFLKMYICAAVSAGVLVVVTFNENKKGIIQEVKLELSKERNSERVYSCIGMKKISKLEYLVAIGTTMGELMIYRMNLNYDINEESFALLLQARVSSGEISVLQLSAVADKMVIGTSNGYLLSYEYNLSTLCDFDLETDTRSIELRSPIRSVDLTPSLAEGLVLLDSGAVNYVSCGNCTTATLSYFNNSKSPIAVLKPLAKFQSMHLMFSQHSSGEVHLWESKRLAHIHKLNVDFDVSLSVYDDIDDRIWLFGSKQELATAKPLSDCSKLTYYEQSSQISRQYVDNPLIIAERIGFEPQAYHLLFSFLGDGYVVDLNQPYEKLKIYKTTLESLRGKVVSVCSTRSGHLAVATNKNKIYIYSYDVESVDSVADIEFKFESVFTLETDNRFDTNWIMMRPGQTALTRDIVHIIGNGTNHLLVYNCATKDVSSIDRKKHTAEHAAAVAMRIQQYLLRRLQMYIN